MSRPWTASGSVLAGLAAAIGASACCAGPLLLLVLGIGGAWGSRLVALEAYQPYFIVAALAFFGYAFYRLHGKPQACAADEVCAAMAVRRRQRIIFWLVAFSAAALMTLPVYAPLFY